MNNPHQKTKLAIVVTVNITAQSFVMGFAKYAATRGFAVTIICDGIEPASVKIGEGRLNQVPVPMKRDPAPLKDLSSLLLLRRRLREIKPDIVAYATPKASLLSALSGFSIGIPRRVYLLRGLRLETTTGAQRKVLGSMEKITSWCSTAVLANSHSLARAYVNLNLNAGRKVEVLGKGSSHGVRVEHFNSEIPLSPLDSGTSAFLEDGNTGLVIGYVGRLHPDKGVNTLLDAARILIKDGLPLKLLLIGSDEGAELDLSGIADSCLQVGAVRDVRPYYSAMDVFVLPSLREGFPNVVLEAASMGLPAIVTDATGVIDSVEDQTTGIVFPAKNSRALATALKSLALDSALGEKMGRAGRKRVIEHFDHEVVWERTLKFLNENPADGS